MKEDGRKLQYISITIMGGDGKCKCWVTLFRGNLPLSFSELDGKEDKALKVLPFFLS